MSLTKPKNQMDDVERINKETGELSTSGEHAVAPDLNLNEGVEMGERGGQPHAHTLRILREMLQQLEIHTQDGSEGTSRQTQTHLSPNHTHSQENTVHQGQILAPLPPDQREGHLFRILPIYIQVCESAVGTEELDLKSLAALSAETVISNIHDRLAKKPAEEARYDVQQYFQERGRMDNTEDKSQADHKEADRSETGVRQTDKSETDDRQTDRSETDHWTTQAGNKGWLLLKTLSLLFATDTRDSMLVVKPGLPAALVKCLYLLVCLPARKEETGGEESFEELLTQVLVQLCSYPSSVKEMMETPELQCLIISLTSLHDLTSSPWRNKASRVLRAVSAAKTTNTIPCLQAKNCVRICIQNLQRISDHAPGPVLAELTATVFSFISDSYQLNPALFTEFETNHGYNVLQDIMTRCEEGVPEEQFRPVEDLLSLIASLCLFGRSELKVALCVTNPQPPGFKFDPSISTGSAVKNLSAFRLLQRSFQRSDDLLLCSQILRTIRSVWSWNRANFFLLEWTVQSLAQVAQCVWRKPPAVHRLFFSMLEMVVFQLNYIPHEAVRAVQAVLKQALAGAVAGGSGFGVIALGSFHRLIVCSSLLAEVLSDGGLLELLLGELRRRAKILRKSGGAGPRSSEDDSERSLTTSMLRVVAALTLRSIRNTVSVRDLGMIPYIKIFLDDEQYRGLTLSILEQLSEVNPDEFMSTTIGALCSSTQHELGLKQDLLQSILKVLENPNSWGAFRRAGGFTGLLSLVVDMEGALGDPGGVWGSVGQKGVLDLLLLILHTLALAVHVDPVSSHHFQAEGYYEKLADALLQLGCFQTEGQETSEVAEGPAGGLVSDGWGLAEGCGLTDDPHSHGRSFHQFVELSENPTPSSSEAPLPPSLQACIRLLSYLDQFSTGTCASLKTGAEQGGEREAQGKRGKGERPQAMSSATLTPEDELQGRSRPSAHSVSTVGSQSNYRVTCEQTILHPGAIRVIVTLLPHVFQAEDPQLSIEVQFSVAHHLQVMVNSERNRQIICGGGLVSTLLTHFRGTLLKTDHPLHLPVTRILEKLASHSISHKDFRSFLCLSNPLMCKARKMSSMSAPESQAQSQSPEEPEMTSEGKNNARPNVKTLKRSFSVLRSLPSVASDVGQPLPLHQIISLVSMTSPRSFRPHSVSTSPAFVEFDMTENGYGCLFLPSLATVKGVNADSIPTGGIGGDCRGFPSAAGLSFSCWFLISRFSLACDSHPIRLLSVVRHMSRAEQQYICLSISFSAGDGCLVISTDEEPFTFLDMMEPEMRPPSQLPGCLRFKCSSYLTPGQWHHLTVVMAKDMKKTCNVSAYLNGKSVGVAKMLYIQPFPGQYVSMEPTAVIDVCAFIGTPSLWKQHAALVWRVGPTYLFEETLSPEAVRVIYNQGTTYLGNYLAVHNTGSGLDTLTPLRLVPEERISFGINTAVATFTTVAQIRESYNEVDCRLIAKEMGIASRDSSTPVFLSLNISQHLTGTARTVGAALVGHFGMRTFAPSSAGDGFLYLGGPVVILSLIAMAADDGALYAAVKVLLSVLETSPAMLREMNRINGYKLLAFLLKTKNGLVTHRTFQLVLSLSGSVDHFGSGTTSLHNKLAFSTLLCDLEVWENTPDHLDLSVLNHFADILKSSSGDHGNAEVMHNLGLVLKLLFLLADPSVTTRKVKLIIFVITRLVMGHFTSTDIRRLGLFLVHTLPPPSVNETSALSDNCLNEDTQGHISSPASPVWIRNQLLSSLCDLVGSDSRLPADEQKELIQTLGSDWFLLFLQPHLHPSSLCLGLRLFTFVLANQSERDSFIEGVSPGILLESLDEPLGIMDNLRSHEWSWECLSVTCPGFDVLQRLLVREAHVPQVYGALAALLLGKGAVDTPDGQVLDEVLQAVINSITLSDWAHLQLCSKSAALLLELVKVLITQTSAAEDSWELQFPGSVMHFLCLLHSHCPRDPLWMSSEFLQALASIIFPPHCTEEEEGLTWVCQTNRKQVCDLIHVVLMDSLLNVPVKEHTHPLLLLLEYSPEGALLEQRQVFQTELLEFLMEIISLPSQEDGHTTHPSTLDSNSQRPEGQPAILMENMVFFIQKFVEKLYSGLFLVEPEVLLVFLVDQIVVVLENGQSQRENAVSSLYNSTNRALLYFMSRPRRTQVEQEAVIRTLRVVVARWDVVMATYNASVHFITCLLHCLLLIRSGSYPEGFGWETHKKHKRKILSHLFPFKTRRTATLTQVPDADKELMSLVESVWCRTLAERRALLEDTYKIELSANQAQRTGPVSMSDLSPLWQETSVKVWQLYTDNVKRKLSSNTQRKPGVISSALRSVHKRLGKERGTVEEFLSCMATHMTRGQEMFENLMKNHIQLRACEWECLETLWLQVEEELLRERGVFGPGPGVVLPQGWVQDAAEGPNRTRPRIRRRAQRRSKRLTDMCLRNALSEGTRGRTDTNSEPRILCDLGTEATEEEVEEEEGEDSDRLTFFPVLTETTTTAPTKPCPAEPTTPDSCSRTHTCSLIHTLLQELQPAEEIKVKACVLVVSGLSVTEGVLLFGSESLYVCEGFTLTPTGDVCCRKHHPTSVRDSYISSMLTTDITSSRRWPYQDIREVHFMRFLLEDNALEIFMQNGYSVFLVFFNKDHVSAFKRLCSLAPALKGRGATEIISNVRRTPVEKAALVKWQRGEISNFEYLMHLNTLSGRTYSDLMQYPVFPWVLADYESETLDLTNPATFRDLSKPMGAQTEKRRQMFIERYNEVDVSEGELTARCHYCTHYSSAIIVSSFLVRMEPFSQTYLTLQGGYDVAERMFHSVKKEWDSASRDNMGDVRELIPEFYYLPDFLVNANHFRLGCMQDGTTLGDVVLPPWAKEDPQEFIRVHREALESDYVSSHLHLWIDLIFGCRQQGPAAVESLNTFHPYFYAKRRGTGRQDPLSDPLIKSTIQGYVNNFGQVPKQLFTKPHPPRTASKKEGSAPAQPTPFFFRLDKLKPSVQPLKEVLGGSVGQVVCAEKEVLVVEKNRLLIPPLWNIYFSWGFPDNSCSFGHYTTEKTFAVCESVCDWGQMLCAACPNQATIVTAGTSSVVCVWDVSISKDKLNHMKLRQVLYGHTDAVTCLAVSEVHGVIVSGSCDLTCILWDLEDLTYVTQLPGHRASITALAINDLTGEIATCAGPSLYLWTMTGQLLTWLDTSCGADVTSGHSERDILSICFTQRNEWDSRNVLVSGSADGIVRIWRTEHNRTSADPLQEPRSPGLPETPVVEDGSGRGQSWERHLVLCCELNRSQSVSRRRYKNNPAVTALAMSRTHATLLVGDAWGRVFTWTCE
ncbi:WD repeat- and FYVE domain-containing protein 4 isoform X2 [Esox lucius]|uniref:WD repeat- and FYVE domain-containing protein 4 isoform X2 n=1 Tax=Esox lucius TaxID=8010 RepID=UPI0014775509|nr:WD repeat- and FYVE domain-containing protein 4 isoform X2 [Esox lucius]